MAEKRLSECLRADQRCVPPALICTGRFIGKISSSHCLPWDLLKQFFFRVRILCRVAAFVIWPGKHRLGPLSAFYRGHKPDDNLLLPPYRTTVSLEI